MNAARIAYLQIWPHYPSIGDRPNLVCGRWSNREDGRIAIGAQVLNQPQKAMDLFIPGRAWAEGVLVDGDLVAAALGDDNQIHSLGLLAPNLTGASARQLHVGRFVQTRARAWSQFLANARSTFLSEGFLEVTTPSLVACPGSEPHLDGFFTRLDLGRTQTEFALPTSPELHLKQLLVGGLERFFEIKTVFRNGEITSTHQPEFLMLEWYRAYQKFEQLKLDLEKLVRNVCQSNSHWHHTTWRELYAELLGEDLRPSTTAAELRLWIEKIGLDRGDIGESETFEDLFHRIAIDWIEPRLDPNRPTTIAGFPPSLAVLARIGADGFAERLEMYWRGLEIANGFHELTDPRANRERIRSDLDRRSALGKKPIRSDERFLSALDHGCPPSVGIAVGLDRLFMAVHGVTEIAETRAFPIELAQP